MTWEERLTELHIALPAVAAPVAAYVPAKRVGNFVYTSGQLPFVDGKLDKTGKVGESVSPDAVCSLNSIKSIVKVVGFVNSAAGFTGQAAVINGASEVLGDIFGESGQHARSAVGVAELPLNAAVEVELIVEVAD